jgi:hypothetical protein
MVCLGNKCTDNLYKGDDDDDNNNNNIILITFMQDIYLYIPETNYVSRLYNVAAVLYSQSVLHVMLFRP